MAPPPRSSRSQAPPPPPPFLPPDDEIRVKLDSLQVRIQIALFITFLIYATILILGRLRSRGNSSMKLISTKSFMVTTYLVSFIPGLMSAPGIPNDLYVFWIAFVAYLASTTNEISCYTLGDNEDRKKRLIIDYAVVWPLILTSLYRSLATPDIIVPIVIIFCIVVLKLRERSRALLYATNSSNGFSRTTKVLSDFSKYLTDEAGQISNFSYDKFLLGIREAQKLAAEQPKKRFTIDSGSLKSKVITLAWVFNDNEPFFVSTDVGKQLQTTCFSFAMFLTLLAKMAGYDKVDPRIFRGDKTLSEDSFALVELELDFLYDYLYTNYYAIYDRGIWRKLRDLCVVSLFFWLALPLVVEYRSQDHNILYVLLSAGLVLDNAFTRFVILAILTIEYSQIGVFLTSKWAKVIYTCAYLRIQTPQGTPMSTKSNFIQWLIRIACLIPRPRLSLYCFSTFTKRKISQYSILNSYDEIPTSVWCKCWIGSYFELPRMGQAGVRNIELSSNVRKIVIEAINNCLGKHGGELTNGVYSLVENGVQEDVISTYVKKVTIQARVILIWHIATSHLESAATKTETNDDDFLEAATAISNYAAYLVAFFPEMLPDHVYTTQCEFDEAVEELKIRELRDEEARMVVSNEDDNLVEQAKKLQKELEKQPNKWKTLAEFWTEMLLFLALSDHGEALDAHANSLCIGGEFITHLWALVTHAGCSRKPIPC